MVYTYRLRKVYLPTSMSVQGQNDRENLFGFKCQSHIIPDDVIKYAYFLKIFLMCHIIHFTRMFFGHMFDDLNIIFQKQWLYLMVKNVLILKHVAK